MCPLQLPTRQQPIGWKSKFARNLKYPTGIQKCQQILSASDPKRKSKRSDSVPESDRSLTVAPLVAKWRECSDNCQSSGLR